MEGATTDSRERADVFEEIVILTNQNLEEKIKRLSNHFKLMATKLPDNGAKILANLKAHEEERERRRLSGLLEDGAGSRTPSLSKTSVRNSESFSTIFRESNEPKQSLFATSLVQKIEKDKDEGSRICDTFGSELRPSNRDSRPKKRQIERSACRGTSKSSRHLGRKVESYSASEKEDTIPCWRSLADITSRCGSEPRGNRPSLRTSYANAKQPVVYLLDEEEAEPEEDNGQKETNIAKRELTIYYPSRDDPTCVEIRYEELKCLSPSMYLTSTIMNFYIRLLQESSSSPNTDQTNYQFFNTYFYKKLQEAVNCKNTGKEALFIKLRRWWKGVNLFQKAYIFLPIHEDHHWSLVIICFPHEADESGPVILHLDSLGYHCSNKIFDDMKRFLKEEWNYLKEEIDSLAVPLREGIWQNLPSRIEEKIITVPQQNNDSDCGVFVLYFMDRFIMEAPERLRKKDLAMFGRKWFKPEEASKMRGKLKKILLAKFLNAEGLFEPLTNHPSDNSLSSSENEVHLVS